MPAERGFVLLEILVAFAIAALALAALYSGGIEGLSASREAERMDEAVSRVQSRMAALCEGARLAPGTQSGDDGSGFAWRSDVTVEGSATIKRGDEQMPRSPLHAELFAVRVTVSWPGMIRRRQVSVVSDCLTVATKGPV